MNCAIIFASLPVSNCELISTSSASDNPDITLLTRISARQLHGATYACLGLIPLLLVIISSDAL
ncbi:hypothetical protein BpHYR1_021804 [Brachionus plicatilis]|uniref:Uncharacterized protein n=1 Tax=Brachionus plicatilis TaxID=10195 RepID=A0A3M7RM58_BRAPC|nr:hypothetical protein BpHYR1_021804 [Brachionus plicatilis]